MKEIEILTKVEDSKENIFKALEEYESLGKKTILDVYFFDPLRGDLQPEDNLRITQCFRLRKKGKKNFLAYKLDNFDDDGQWIYSDEHETLVENFEETMQIITHLGFKELVRIKNIKHIYKTSVYEIVFEEVENLGYFLEVEKLTEVSNKNIHKAKEEIRFFLKNLGIKLGEELNAGKPELMLQKQNM